MNPRFGGGRLLGAAEQQHAKVVTVRTRAMDTRTRISGKCRFYFRQSYLSYFHFNLKKFYHGELIDRNVAIAFGKFLIYTKNKKFHCKLETNKNSIYWSNGRGCFKIALLVLLNSIKRFYDLTQQNVNVFT